jgi:hypothetical protein
MPKLTLKSLKEAAKAKDCNSSKEALQLMKRANLQSEQGLKIWECALQTAGANNRRTVLPRDVQGLLNLWQHMQGGGGEAEEAEE